MSITPAMIKELRDKTGLGLKKCKEALVESNGDVDLAVEALRKAGMASAEKRMGRATSQGSVFTFISEDGKKGGIVAVSCETDFVAKTDDFKAFGKQTGSVHGRKRHCRRRPPSMAPPSMAAREDLVKEHISKLGENVNISNAQSFSSEGQLFLHPR